MSSPHPGIEGLVELARRDRVELRPVLLRVLTDLYVQQAVHGPAEKARFAELTCRLLDSVDLETRAAVAKRLAPYAGTPPPVAGKLARDEISVADPILRRSSVLSEAELHSILDSRGIAHAVAIAARENLPRSIAVRLRESGAVRAQKDAHKDQARMANRTSTQAVNPAVTFTLARRFLVTNADERRLILTAIACCPPVDDEERLRRLDRGFNDELERAALRHHSTEFMMLLHDHAGMPGDIAARIVSETSGEPLAVVCRALDMPFNTASRILLFLYPAIGGSVQRVFRLASRYEEAKPEDARRLTAAWCGLGAGLSAQRREWTRPVRARNDPRSTARRTIRGVTPARPAAANES